MFRTTIFYIVVLAVVAVMLPTAAQAQYACLPTCDDGGARFLTIAGTGLSTLAGDMIVATVSVPSTYDSFEIGVFDGDTSGRWDLGSVATSYTVYADPEGDGTGGALIAQWSGGSMPDNDWFTSVISTGPEAQSPNGNYFYTIEIENGDPSLFSLNAFRLRSNAFVGLVPQAIAFVASMFNVIDAEIVYPNGLGDLSTTVYDGDFNFHFWVPANENLSSLAVWDGDLDFGPGDCSAYDTDDPNTPNDSLPDWAVGTAANFEGAAVGAVQSTWCTASGDPADDNFVGGNIFLRSPSIQYHMDVPGGDEYLNTDPSGDEEWERFVLSTGSGGDYQVDSLPGGLYHVHLEGLDLSNLNAIRLPYTAVCVDEDGKPCGPPLCTDCGTGTIGYWKNHFSKWPVVEIELGGVLYTADEALCILWKKARGDKSYTLAKQLIATKLNVFIGTNPSCISDTIEDADAWLAANPLGSGVGGSSSAWRNGGKSLKNTLDSYNNGRLCAPSRG